jgi:AcrR family transcriptional regulator
VANKSVSTVSGTQTRPRPQLDPELIVDAALRLAARDRTSPVSIRSLGTELGADPTAVYRHFADKDALVRAVLDRLLGDVNERVEALGGWRERLRGAAEILLEVMVAHPAFGSLVATFTTGGANELAAVEMILGDFKTCGLDDQTALRYYATYSSFVLSFSSAQAASLLVAGDKGSPGTDIWVADYSEADPLRFPTVARLHEGLSVLSDRDVFLSGIDILLDSAQTRAQA